MHFDNLVQVVGVIAGIGLWLYRTAQKRQREAMDAAAAPPVTVPGVRIPDAPGASLARIRSARFVPPATPAPAPAPRPVVPESAVPTLAAAPAARAGLAAAGRAWAANAIVAAEVFGPPVALRPGGTLRPPGAF